MKRRKFIKRAFQYGVGISATTGFYTWQIEPFMLQFVRQNLAIKHLPKELERKKLMQISDIHVGNRFDYQYLIDSFKRAQLYNPDFVVYTGDYVSYENEEQHKQLDEVLKHVVTGKLDTFGILGNHDYGHNWSQQSVADKITSQLENVGIRILSNEKQSSHGLNFIGLDDYWGLNFSPSLVMNQANNDEAHLVLCHNPDVCDLDVWHDYKGWILSGHTHGGQCKPPFLKPPILPVKNNRYTAGEIDLFDGRTLYINRALGHLRQVRFNVRPEITLFNLISG